MRSTAGSLAAALIAIALSPLANAQETAKPDYSKQTLVKIFASDIKPPEHDRNIEWHPTYVDFKALNMRWRFNFIPMLMPLQGSFPTTQGLQIPNPFALTHTEYPYTPRTWRDTRAMSQELQRIEKIEKQRRAKVKVTPE